MDFQPVSLPELEVVEGGRIKQEIIQAPPPDPGHGPALPASTYTNCYFWTSEWFGRGW
jgi:hypothetical protein